MNSRFLYGDADRCYAFDGMGTGAAGKKRGAIAFIFIILRMPAVQCAGFITTIIARATGNNGARNVYDQ
ncbi:hypothetical protein A4R26_08150 [Niastella populi]|uniref:Uncharacterized protein n=1 Tax=Niastella populi TaxID=550983 RepID=A0A1V9EKK1_9BACT|nr:hypothetical protein A4R26_08150 [Niastella populi]